VRLGSGVAVLISALMFVWAILVAGRTKQATLTGALQPAE
jgi:nitric oxide reductase subunit B